MAKNISWVTTRDEAIEEFEQCARGVPDIPARREAWHDFVNWLHSNHQISDWQATNWNIPDCCG